MPSLLAVSGLNVDRAFPGLGTAAAERRRALAITGLVNVVRAAESAGADTILIVGGLFDDRTVSATALSTVVPLLNAFAGRVLIAPGVNDPYAPQSAHATTEWGPRTSVWTTADFADPAITASPRILGRALRPGGSGVPAFPFLARGDDAIVLAAAALPIERCMAWAADGAERHIVTTGPREALLGGVTILEAVNPETGSAAGHGALITMSGRSAVSVEFVDVLDEASGESVDLSVTELSSTEALLTALDQAVAVAPPWSIVRVVGTLAQGVLLPGMVGHSPDRDDVLTEVGELSFAFDEPDAADRTAMAEFVRSLSLDSAEERSRHQAIALGLAAFEAAAREQAEP